MTDKDAEEPTESKGTPVAWAVGFVVVSWLATGVFGGIFGQNWGGTWGDTFGSINALFSGLAFVGLIYAILLQRQELSLQRKELTLNRQELSGQRDALEKQNRAIELQIFDGTLFQMLSLLNQITSSIDVTDDHGTEKRGRDAFSVFIMHLKRHLNSTDDIVTSVIGFTHEEGAELWPYGGMIINIVTYIENAGVDDRKWFYMSMVRSLLARDESIVLLYLLLLNERAKTLVEKHHLFVGLAESECILPEHYKLYGAGAYAEADAENAPV